MNIKNKYISRLLVVALFVATLVSCSEDIMDDINKDTAHPLDASAKFLLADVITSTAFNNVGGDFNTYASVYVEHEAGAHNQLYRADQRQNEPTSASTFNNVWGNIYTTLKNAKIVVEKCSEGGSQEGNDLTRGAGEVMVAYNLALLTDMFGDTPWSEACNWETNMTPKIDSQESIYAAINSYLDNAIVHLQGSDAHGSGGFASHDLLYGGDTDKWLQFAYGLKARYTMRLLKRSANQAADLQKVIDYVGLSFQSADDQAAFSKYDENNLNPLFDFQWSRDGIAASQSMFDKLDARKDPRARRVYYDCNSWGNLAVPEVLVPNGGGDEVQYYYNYSAFVYAQIAPTYFLSYHELLFLKAEAMCRLNQAGADEVLKSAVVAAIQNTEVNVNAAINAPSVLGYGGLEDISADAITTAEAEEYFNTEVKPLFDANPLQETMIQKYIALWGANGESTECFSDIRRLKGLNENFIVLANPKNATQFPLRCPYGNDDTTTNPAVKDAFGTGQYVYSEPVWWAGGTR